jgi:hypothetical protein
MQDRHYRENAREIHNEGIGIVKKAYCDVYNSDNSPVKIRICGEVGTLGMISWAGAGYSAGYGLISSGVLSNAGVMMWCLLTMFGSFPSFFGGGLILGPKVAGLEHRIKERLVFRHDAQYGLVHDTVLDDMLRKGNISEYGFPKPLSRNYNDALVIDYCLHRTDEREIKEAALVSGLLLKRNRAGFIRHLRMQNNSTAEMMADACGEFTEPDPECINRAINECAVVGTGNVGVEMAGQVMSENIEGRNYKTGA